MHMDKGMDTGAVYLREYYDLPTDITTGKLHDWMAEEGAKHLLTVVRDLEHLEAIPQVSEGETYASKWSREDINIIRELNIAEMTANEFCQRVRGLSPWSSAQMSLKGETVKVLMAEPVEGSGDAGTVLHVDQACLLYTSDAADDSLRVDLGGRRIIKKLNAAVVLPPTTLIAITLVFSSRRRHTRFMSVSWARRCV